MRLHIRHLFSLLSEIIFLSVIYSCDPPDFLIKTYNFTYDSTYENLSYFLLYGDLSDFSNGKNPITPTDSQKRLDGSMVYHLSDTIRGKKTITNLLVDIRNQDGSNNWNDKSVNRFLTRSSNEPSPKGFSWQNYDFSITKSLVSQVANTPATYLHLCLSSLYDPGGSKTWKIQSIRDEKNKNLLLNPLWFCFSGLSMSFEKGGDGARAALGYAANGPCANQSLVPGTSSQGYATYSIGGDKGDELIFTYPNVTDKETNTVRFFILDSGFDHLDLKITGLAAQPGFVHLVPGKYLNTL